MTVLPFFARFLDTQKTVGTKTPAMNPGETMHTLKYPSDNDTFNPNDRGYDVKLRHDVFAEPSFVKFRPEVLQNAVAGELKEANSGWNPNKPGNVVTLAYPSDSDVIGGRQPIKIF